MCLVIKYDLIQIAVTLGNVTFAFPPVGIGCEYWPEVSGKAVIVPLKRVMSPGVTYKIYHAEKTVRKFNHFVSSALV